MKSERFDVIVVGGGPAGSVAARTAAQHGAKVLQIEEHTKIGKPIQCTGLLSVRGFQECGASPEIILRKITGAYVYAPDGRRLAIGGDRLHAYVINRDRLDQNLVQLAANAGVRLRDGLCAVRWQPGRLTVRSRSGTEETLHAPVVIGADGPHSKLAQEAKLLRPQKFTLGFQAVIPYQPPGRNDFVEVFLGREIAPDFFGWAVPALEGYGRVGLMTSDWKNARSYFDQMLNVRRFSKKIVEFQSGVIPIGPAPTSVAQGLILVGDATGQAKPTSGGGIYTSSTCAKIAGEVAAQCALSGQTSARALEEYDRRWRALLETELHLGMQAHRLLCKLDDTQLNRLFAVMDHPEMIELISQHGDIDYPSRIAIELLKRPRLWGRLLSLLPADVGTLVRMLRA
jgi:geranylgeranyl reductase family protein